MTPINFCVLPSVMKMDTENVTLHQLLQGKAWAIATVSSYIPEDDFPKIMAVGQTLLESAHTLRARYERSLPVPSDYAKQHHQKDAHVIDHRNIPGEPSLHISLQCRLFGAFRDELSPDPPEKYLEYATKVMQRMSGYYNSELERQNAFFEAVKFCRNDKSIERNRGKSDRTICVTVDDREYPIVNFEFTNEFGSALSCPNKQNIAYFLNFKAGEDNASIDRCRSPMLLVAIIGTHYLQVFGSVWNGSKVCVDPLTRPLSLLFVPRDPDCGVTDLAQVFAALDSAIPRLEAYYKTPDYGAKGPYFSCDTIDYQGCISYIKWLFSATMDDTDVCVKFVPRRYGTEVHRFLAHHNLAPQLLKTAKLPGGWIAIVMEKIVHGHTLQKPVSPQVQECLRQVLHLMHTEQYVHGDLRPQNIIVAENKVYIIDFDWAGKEGEATYPPTLNVTSENNWAPGVMPTGHIKKEHDEYHITQFTD